MVECKYSKNLNYDAFQSKKFLEKHIFNDFALPSTNTDYDNYDLKKKQKRKKLKWEQERGKVLNDSIF